MTRPRSVRIAPPLVAFTACTLALGGLAPAAPIQYVTAYHADDVIGQTNSAHDESPSFGQTTASLPAGSSTSLLTGSDAILSFTATQTRSDADQPMVHTLVSVSFVPSRDTYFTLTGGYNVPGPTPAGETYVGLASEFADMTDLTELYYFDHYGRIDTPFTLALPDPSTHLLLANHTYGISLEAANETYPFFDGGTTATAYFTFTFTPVPLPPSLAMGSVCLAILARRRRARPCV